MFAKLIEKVKRMFSKEMGVVEPIGWNFLSIDETIACYVKNYKRKHNDKTVEFFVEFLYDEAGRLPVSAFLNFKDQEDKVYQISDDIFSDKNIIPKNQTEVNSAIFMLEDAIAPFIEVDLDELLKAHPEFYSVTAEDLLEEVKTDVKKIREIADENNLKTNSKKKSAKSNSRKFSSESDSKPTKKQKGADGTSERLDTTQSDVQKKPARKKRGK